MKIIVALTCMLLFCSLNIISQTISFNPYLQDATPNSMVVMWQTDIGTESTVQWGTTASLGNTATGSTQNIETEILHTVLIEGLQRFTKYYYRVQTGTASSDIFSFKTPPFASQHKPFRMVAMSDMQRDDAHPNKFNEIIEDGVIDYLNDEIGGELIDNLALVMIPGDLVNNGNAFLEWEETFFTPAQNLFNQVPVYPVTGNHEYNTPYYFQYFHLPDNGTAGFEEHWWFKDFGNTRLIGMDSNTGYRLDEQLDWLENVLNEACTDEDIDFVFAQLHHPHLSELWKPGELDYTGDVIERLENFSTACDKPSIHFFGHTHAYSRGQSRDHKHLWINAATAGGAIDNWGEFANFDYDEFSVSQDDYGFVVVEVTDDDDPKIVVKRISRGDQDNVLDNILTDSLTLRKNASHVQTPTAIFPNNITLNPECVTLKGSTFSSSNPMSQQGQSHWQVTTSENDYSNPVFESWKNFENWYFEEDTQANDDLGDEFVTGLSPDQQYWWRVRYRDRGLNWSDWTSSTPFTTDNSQYSANLIINPGAELNLNNWTIVQGVAEAVSDGECNGISPHTGTLYFAVGGICEHSDVGILIQDVDVTMHSDSIDSGDYSVKFGGFLSNYGGQDVPEIKLIFLNNASTIVGESNSLSNLSSTWVLYQDVWNIPPTTRTIRMELKGTRINGTDNDSYFDDLFLRTGPSEFECSAIPDEGIQLNLSTILQGPYDEDLELMTDFLRENGSIPLMEPYTNLGFNHVNGGGEMTLQSVLDITGNNAVVDWIFVELRDAANPTDVLSTQSALLQRDGQIVDVDGVSPVTFDNVNVSSVFVVLRHRNHFGVRTAASYSTLGPITVDFSNPSLPVYGAKPMYNLGFKRALISGDANNDGQVNSIDKNAFWRIENGGVFDYIQTKADFNLDGITNPVDKNSLWRNNNSKFEQLD